MKGNTVNRNNTWDNPMVATMTMTRGRLKQAAQDELGQGAHGGGQGHRDDEGHPVVKPKS